MVDIEGMAPRLRDLRRQRGYTLLQLAQMCGCSKNYIWELENNPGPRTSAVMVYRLARALDVTTDYLINADQAPSDWEEAILRTLRHLSDTERQAAQAAMLEIVDAAQLSTAAG